MRHLFLMAAAVLVLGACQTGGSTTPPPPSVPPPASNACPATITITASNTYSPSSCSLQVGQSVKISAGIGHPLSGSGAGKGVTSATSEQTLSFATAGTFNFSCDVHGGAGMTGSITVKP